MDARFWSTVPTDRAVYLRGAAPESVELALENAENAPAIVAFSARTVLGVPDLVHGMLTELDRVARGLLPHWLPEARTFGTSSAGLAAVRAVASRRAHELGVPAALLADLAARAAVQAEPRRGRFVAETWAAALARIIASATNRDRVVLLVRARQTPPSGVLDQVVTAGQWLAHHGGIGVWLAGQAWRAVADVAIVDVPTTDDLPDEEPVDEEPLTLYPPVSGTPRWNSPYEQALEAALADKPWAAGRRWNVTYQSHPLANPICIDLLWPEERCAVEIDGSEHRLAARFEADRRRDVQLQLDGFAVLRFTNKQIHHDVGAVVSQIKQFLTARRKSEGSP